MATKITDNMATAKVVSLDEVRRGRGVVYDAAKECDNNVIGSRIRAARENQGLSLTSFSEMLSRHGLAITRQAIGKWEIGKSVPSAYQLLAICHALNIEDGVGYFTNEPKRADELNEMGKQKLADYKADLIASGKYAPSTESFAHTVKRVRKGLAALPVSAGPGEFLDDDSFEEIEYPENAIPNGADFGVRVNGDSMEPVYHDGQIVWVQRCDALNPGEIGIFEYDGCGYLKIYGEQNPSDELTEAYLTSDGVLKKQPVMYSYNEKYDPIVVSPHVAFHIAGRVLN